VVRIHTSCHRNPATAFSFKHDLHSGFSSIMVIRMNEDEASLQSLSHISELSLLILLIFITSFYCELQIIPRQFLFLVVN
jgi:hypothetical protein